MAAQPTGTVTLFFSDIEGSTRLLEHLGRERYAEALAVHRDIFRRAFADNQGYEVDHEGDAFFAAFPSAGQAIEAAVAAQRNLEGAAWPADVSLRVRIGLHTGEPLVVPPKFVGLDVHRAARIMAAGHGGQVLLSERTATLVDKEFPDGVSIKDLGEHRLKDLSRAQRLYELTIDGLMSEFPPLKTLGGRATNLPAQPNPLVGRRDELDDVASALRGRKTRLVTLVGPGGTGKTRIALHTAAELGDEFADGVFVVFLASLQEPALVLDAIATTLGLRPRGGETVEDALVSYLAERNVLLLLDNFEHLLGAAPTVSRMLATAPRLSLLITTREPLHVTAERVFDIGPLSVPSSEASSPAGVLEHDAVALFVERATAAKADFELDAGNLDAVAEICIRLDGLPLAIELAAARLRAFSPTAILTRLDQRLALLTGGARDADERQRTLRDTIAWSHDLLSPHERTLFARLAVFASGCRPSEAEAVCNIDGDIEIDTLDGLTSLVDKSLLRVREDHDGEPRFWMLETIREYAFERLQDAEEAEAMRRKHAVAYAALVEQAEVELRGPKQLVWLRRLDAEQDNVRAAIGWALGHDVETALQLTGSLYQYWEYRGLWNEGIRWTTEALERASGRAGGGTYARALFSAGFLVQIPGRSDESQELLGQALLAFRELDDRERMAYTLGEMAWAKIWRAELDEAGLLFERARSLALESGDRWLIAHSTLGLAACLTEGPLDPSALLAAEELQQESLRLCQEAGDEIMATRARGNLGWLALIREDYGDAKRLFEACLSSASNAGDELNVGTHWSNLALVALFEGDDDAAVSWAHRFLKRFLKLGDMRIAAESLLTLAGVAAKQNETELAGRLSGAAHAILQDIHAEPSVPEARIEERLLNPARESAPDAFDRGLKEGRAVTLTEAIHSALDDTGARIQQRPPVARHVSSATD
jgi:predicted ATPase/class 3 adenylate cyclase